MIGSVRRPICLSIRFIKGLEELVFSSPSRNTAADSAVVIDMPNYPSLGIENLYTPRAPMSEKGFLEELPPSSAFNPGTLDSKHKLEDFVCNVHVAHGVLQACPLILHL